jgi:hypothetical protein
MKILSREAINRMVGNSRSAQGSQFSRGSGGGGGQAVSLANLSDVAISTPIDGGSVLTFGETAGKWVAGPDVLTTMWDALSATGTEQIDASHLTGVLGDYATETWVSQNYISIAYFDRLFRAYNGNVLVNHNDEESTIDNIEAMFGFWTKQYISALGNSGGGSVSLTLANMGDVSLNNLADGQILVYDATEGKWVNESASIVGNYLPLTGGTLTGDLFFTGYNNRVFGIKRTYSPVGVNIDVGWDWSNRDGSGAYFRSVDAGDRAGDFGFYARNATDLCELVGKPDGTLTWGNNPILTSANVKTINGESIYGSGNIVVGGGGSAYLPLSGGTMTGNITLKQGVAISSGGYPLLVFRPSNLTTISSTQWGVGANDSQGVIRSSASDLLHWRGDTSGQAYAILDEYNATTILNGSYLPLTGGTLTGRLTINSGVLNITGGTPYAEGIRIHDVGGISSIWFRCSRATEYDAGMWGITANSNGMRFRGAASPSATSPTDYINIIHGGNVGIGTTSPNYKLHVNGTLGAGNTSVANLESEGYVSALSDIRKKEVVEHMDGLTIEQIASMPIIKFTWRDRPEEGLQVGSVAQEWQKILPQSVHKSKNDYLSFSYGVAALVSSISTARKVVDHEKRIAELERENKELKMKLNIV